MLKTGKKSKAYFLLIGMGLGIGLLLCEFLLDLGLARNSYHYPAVLEGELQSPRKKILILGDSFAAKWGNGESLYEQMVPAFEKQGAQVLNTAEFGSGPLDYWIQMKTHASKFRPDLILLFYYPGNDLTNIWYPGPVRNAVKKVLKPWMAQSRLYYFLKSKIEEIRSGGIRYQEIYGLGTDPEAARLLRLGAMNPWLVDLGTKKKNYVLDNLKMEDVENQKAWQEAQDLLRTMARQAERQGSSFTIVILPSSAQISPDHLSFYEKLNFRVDPSTLQEAVPQDRMNQFCRQEKIECLDLLPEFRSQSGRKFFMESDDHFSPEGNALAAKKILDYLEAVR